MQQRGLRGAAAAAAEAERTRVIVVVHLFGLLCDMDPIQALAAEHVLLFFYAPWCGHCQSPLPHFEEAARALAGVDVTLAERLQLIRNHAESVVEGKGVTNLSNMIGGNFRLGELEAAIGITQFSKLDHATKRMQYAGELLTEGLNKLGGIRTPIVRANCSHVYYAYALVLDPDSLGVSRDRLVDALSAEGVPLGKGYQNLHLLPMFQKRIAYGKHGFPWSSSEYKGNVDYKKGICPVAEDLHDKSLVTFPLSLYEWSDDDLQLTVQAFNKVWNHLDALR